MKQKTKTKLCNLHWELGHLREQERDGMSAKDQMTKSRNNNCEGNNNKTTTTRRKFNGIFKFRDKKV